MPLFFSAASSFALLPLKRVFSISETCLSTSCGVTLTPSFSLSCRYSSLLTRKATAWSLSVV
jgi:hypothetical protein